MANELVDKTESLPELPNREQVFARAAEAEPTEPKALRADLHSLARPPSRRDIGGHLAIIIGCFPNAKTDDAEIYGRALAEYVEAAQASLSDLEASRHRLIKTFRFRPSIAEVLEILEAEKQKRLRYTDRIEYIVSHPEPDATAISRHRQQPKRLQTAYATKSRDDDEDINY